VQSAICARSRRLVRLERATESLISWAVPNFPQALLGGIAERVILVAPLREWRDEAWQCPAIGCDVHDGPRPAAQRPSGATVAALQPNRSKSVRIVCHERRVSIWFATIREILRHETAIRGKGDMAQTPPKDRVCRVGPGHFTPSRSQIRT
jgi:hypothetical protein